MNRRIEKVAVSAAIAAAGTLALLAALWPPAAGAIEQNDRLIVPWKRIGPAALGMSATELVNALGSPGSITPGTVENYSWHDLTATITPDRAWVTQVCTFSANYATAEGIRPGSTDSEVTQLLGQPKYVRVFNGFWRFSYTDLYWPGMMISVHIKGYAINHAVWKICVNRSAAIAG